MAKSESKKQNKSSAPKIKSRKAKSLWLKLTILAVLVVVVGGYGLYKFINEGSHKVASVNKEDLAPYQLKEKRPTLLPVLFQGQVAQVYEAAGQIPKVLDQVHCYCKCEENFGHKSLLSCFVDRHAATWGICIEEAQLASRKYQEGNPIKKIREMIDKQYKGS